MDFKKMKDMIIDMQEQNYDYFVKALISVEKGIEDEKVIADIWRRTPWDFLMRTLII